MRLAPVEDAVTPCGPEGTGRDGFRLVRGAVPGIRAGVDGLLSLCRLQGCRSRATSSIPQQLLDRALLPFPKSERIRRQVRTGHKTRHLVLHSGRQGVWAGAAGRLSSAGVARFLFSTQVVGGPMNSLLRTVTDMYRTRFLRLFALLSFLVGMAAAQNYAPAVNYAAGAQPVMVVSADFNGDGKADLMVVNAGSNTLTFLAGNGDGTFTEAGTIPLDGTSPDGLGTADLNGDGKADVVVSYSTGSVQLEVLFGVGDGTFGGPVHLSLPAPFDGSNGNGGPIVIADFNGDGAPDIAVPGAGSGILVFLNTGGGIFSTPATAECNIGGSIVDFVAADINRDGHMDFAFVGNPTNLGGSTRNAGYCLGNGDGSFQSAVTVGSGGLLGGIAAADINGDGRLDLLYTDPALTSIAGGQIHVELQQADGSFLAGTTVLGSKDPLAMVVGDFNGDGKQDFAVAQDSKFIPLNNAPDEVIVYLGNGDGTFNGGTAFAVATAPLSIIKGSFTGTGALDLATADNSASEASVLVNQGANRVTVTTSKQPALADLPVTLTATVAGIFVAGAPSGSVIFADGNTTLGVGTLNGSGVATLSTQIETTGAHNIVAVYGGDGTYVGGTSGKLTQQVVLGNPNVGVTAPPTANVGQAILFAGSVTAFDHGGTPQPTGTATLVIDGSNFATATIDANGAASFSVSSLALGSHRAMLNYSGDSIYDPGGSPPLTVTVQQAATNITVASTAAPSVVGQAVTLTATVQATTGGPNPTGSVTISDGITSLGTFALNASGQASVTLSNPVVGAHNIVVSYPGNTNFLSSSTTFNQVVNQAATASALTVTPGSIPSGGSVTVSSHVTVVAPGAGSPTGSVTFKDGATTLGSATVASGVASTSVIINGAGPHTVTAIYGGDSNFTGSTSAGSAETVVQSSTSTTLASSPGSTVFGQVVSFTATVIATGGGSGIATGPVVFKDGSNIIGTVNLDGTGKAVLSLGSLVVGSHSVVANYQGDSNFQTSMSNNVGLTVSKSPSSSTLGASPNPAVFGQSASLTVTVVATGGGAGVPTGTVSCFDGATLLGTATVNASGGGGQATLSTSSLSVGSHSITCTYNGDGNFVASTSGAVSQSVNKSGSAAVVISSQAPSTFGQGVTFSIAVGAAAPGSGIPSGSVTLSDGATVLGTVPLDGTGAASFAPGPGFSAGSHSLSVSYPGDGNFLGTTSPTLTQVVNKAGTTVAMTSSLNPSTNASAVTLGASVASAVNGASGSVTFMDGSSPLGTGTINSSGSASLTLPSLGTGMHALTAVYSGDANFQNSQSSGLGQKVVDSHSAVVVISSINPQTASLPVTFAASVTSALGGPMTSGKVSFMDGGTVLGVVPVSGGSAVYTTSALGTGNHSVVGVYQQSASPGPFDGQSSGVGEQINPVNTGVGGGGQAEDYQFGIATNQATMAAGQSFTTEATLTPVNGLTGPIAFVCGGLPQGATCTVNPNPTSLDGTSPASASFTIQTTGGGSASPSSAAYPSVGDPTPRPDSLVLFLVAGVVGLLTFMGRKRLALGLRVPAFGLALMLGAALVGCGGTRFETQPLSNATPSGTYTVVLQSTSGSLAHSIQITLIVK